MSMPVKARSRSGEEWFDAVVVGSGFGGSVMAYRLANDGLDVCLLERGRSWPPGSFPRTPYQFSQALWDPSQGRYGLYDLWSFGGLGALVSSGLGGGSLIYANVILPKPRSWFVEKEADGVRPWPITYDDLAPHYKAVRPFLGAVEYPLEYRGGAKTSALVDAAETLGLQPTYPPLAVTFATPGDEPGKAFGSPADNLHNAQRYTCRLGGECDVGCNLGSKNSLDFTYLSRARGLKIKCLHEVKAFEQYKDGFRIEVADHSNAEPEEGPREGPPAWRVVFAKRLILSAGALGTPYLLLRNRSAFPRLSPLLGTRFSGNGDFIAFAARSPTAMEPSRGPVITAAVHIPDRVDGGKGAGHVIEDGGYPAFLAWVGWMIALPRIAWAGRGTALKLAWNELRDHPDSNLSGEVGDLLGSPQLAGGTLPMLGMGREPPQGRMRLRNGLLDVEWSFAEAKAYFDQVRSTVQAIADELGAEFEDNALWRLNASITVHPLGGCPMGETEKEGVVSPANGEVHNYKHLHVADGSVMPGTVGTNPSFTIAAVANRFADAILGEPKL
ncbi:MAG TPA: GMC family oxidoreductase [Gaiellaceae bacterium]|nr:GMC family oxidoreductase [Gaiellaceae bacterium]